MKKVLAIILAVVMLIGVLPISALAAPSTPAPTSKLSFKIVGGTWDATLVKACGGTLSQNNTVVTFTLKYDSSAKGYVYECDSDNKNVKTPDTFMGLFNSSTSKPYTPSTGYSEPGTWAIESGGTVRWGTALGGTAQSQMNHVINHHHYYDDHGNNSWNEGYGFQANTVYVFTLSPQTPHSVTYRWSNAPDGTVYNASGTPVTLSLPATANYYQGQTYTVDSTYSSGTVVYSHDSFGNVNGKYTFSGWKLNDKVVTGNQKMGEANVTLSGVWAYEDVDVPEYTVSYQWSGTPSGTVYDSDGNEVTLTLPSNTSKYVNGQSYPVDNTYSSGTVVYSHDSFGNVNGKYTFSGWKLNNKVVTGNQTMGKANVILTGVWTYEDVDVTEYTVSYSYTGTVPTDATELPADASYVKNQPVNVAADATATGYDFSGWSTADATVAEDGSFKMPEKDVAFTGSFSAKTDVSYTVHYYKVGTTTKLADDKKVSNKTFNETYEEKAIDIDDYKLVSNEKQSIKLDAYDKEIIFYYEPNNPALEVTKTVDIEAPSVGDTVTYTIKVKNTGNISFEDLELADTMTGAAGTIDTSKLPDGVTYKDGKFTIASLPESREVTFTYTYTVLESDAGKTISNKVVIPENINGEDVTVEIVVKNPGLNVTKTVDKSLASVGSTLNYKITVKNTGNVDFTNVTVADTFNGSGKLEYSKLPEGVTYDSQNNVFVIGQLKAGDEVVINLTYDVVLTDSLTAKFLQNKAVVSAFDGNKEYTDESTSGKTTIIPLPVLDTDDHEAYIIGYSDGTVRPEKSITRAEVATIFFRLLEDDSRAAYWSQTNEFSDVNSGDWYNNAISTLANAGILTGYSDGTFKPNAPITRAEFAAIVSRFSEVVYNGGSSFTDVPSSHWAARYIALAEHLGWINGYTDGTFKPDKNITRAEAMTLINRVLEREVEQEHMLPNMMTWSDNTPDKWYYEAVQEATNSHTYTRTNVYVPGQTFQYEHWKTLLENPDWKALEQTWSDAN